MAYIFFILTSCTKDGPSKRLQYLYDKTVDSKIDSIYRKNRTNNLWLSDNLVKFGVFHIQMFKYIQVGDSLSKDSNSFVIRVYRLSPKTGKVIEKRVFGEEYDPKKYFVE